MLSVQKTHNFHVATQKQSKRFKEAVESISTESLERVWRNTKARSHHEVLVDGGHNQ